MAFLFVYVTHASEEEAGRISRELLEARLIACANIHRMESMYWWSGVIEHGAEWVSILKTSINRWEALEEAITRTHPYDTPCILKMEVSANKAYEDWIHAQTAS
jgi:periplasmic divalent cation tolerance protein